MTICFIEMQLKDDFQVQNVLLNTSQKQPQLKLIILNNVIANSNEDVIEQPIGKELVDPSYH